EKNGINNTRDNDPFPKLVSYDKTMGIKIGLDRYYNFFEQGLNLSKYKEPRLKDLNGLCRNWILNFINDTMLFRSRENYWEKFWLPIGKESLLQVALLKQR